MRLAGLVAFGVFGLDQASKYAVVHILELHRRLAIDVWPPYLNFRMAWNQGVNFGLFAGEGATTRWILIAVSLAISAWVWMWSRKEANKPGVQLSAGLLIGGAMGNVVDRLLYGAVADFLNMSCCGLSNPFSFNVADISIFAGALGLALFSGNPAPKRGKTP